MSAHTRRSRGKSLKRKTETKAVLRTFRIYAEGKSTEPEYIDAIKRLPEFAEGISIVVSIEQTGAAPLTLVDSACRDKRNSKLDIDFYWCVFDVESPQNHPNLNAALDKARANDVQVAVSNPCFEVWLILHLDECARYLSTDDAVSLRGRLDGSVDKHLDPGIYLEHRALAARRARALRLRHQADGTRFPQDNPSSSFDGLVAHFEREVKTSLDELNETLAED